MSFFLLLFRFFFLISSYAYAFIKFNVWVAIVLSILLTIFLFLLFKYGYAIYYRFQIPDEQVVSGEVKLGGFDPEHMSSLRDMPTGAARDFQEQMARDKDRFRVVGNLHK